MLETVLYVVGIIAFTLVTIDSVIDFVKDSKKKKEVNSLHGYIDNLEDRIMGKFEIVDISIENLSTRTQELDEMIRWYAGELKEEELKDWTYIQPDGSVKISSLKGEIEHKPETEDNDAFSTLWNAIYDEYKQRKKLSQAEESQSEQD